MNREKISSQEIIDLVSVKAQVSKRVAEEFLKLMISTIEDTLIAGESVKVKGLGTFKLQWNESRKSVNVKTGDEILLDGYYKVSFTPETSLKELVNEPFAHLEPVLLDSENNFVIPEEPTADEFDPLKIFSEQASEIKDILSEINALSAPVSAVEEESRGESFISGSQTQQQESVCEANDDISDELDGNSDVEVVEEDENVEDTDLIPDWNQRLDFDLSIFTSPARVSQIETEPVQSVAADTSGEEGQLIVHEFEYESGEDAADDLEPDELEEDESSLPSQSYIEQYTVPHVVVEAQDVSQAESPEPKEDADLNGHSDLLDFASTPFMVNARKHRRRTLWIWSGSGLVLLLFGILFGFYYFNLEFSNYVDSLFTGKPAQSKVTHVSPKPVATKILAPSSTVKPEQAQSKVVASTDTLSLLKKTRTYDDFIASEQIRKGVRLEVLALKYYGNTVFWVYIYEANKERIEHPDVLLEGTLIRIPKLDTRIVDIDNPRCISYAQSLSEKYLRK